ncbi:hypothetical protein SUGI_0716210 [Cryptomeria japonica]|nr:hypothetical protein SUGI_0716210 [Cryptomeria japonica]
MHLQNISKQETVQICNKDKICLELYINPSRCQTTYNSMPPPMDEVQIAKERAQEIAARLINNSNSGAGNTLEADHPRPPAATNAISI